MKARDLCIVHAQHFLLRPLQVATAQDIDGAPKPPSKGQLRRKKFS